MALPRMLELTNLRVEKVVRSICELSKGFDLLSQRGLRHGPPMILLPANGRQMKSPWFVGGAHGLVNEEGGRLPETPPGSEQSEAGDASGIQKRKGYLA